MMLYIYRDCFHYCCTELQLWFVDFMDISTLANHTLVYKSVPGCGQFMDEAIYVWILAI